MEHIERLHLLTHTDELDRFIDHRTDRECSTAACITIQFGQYNTIEIQTIVEFLSGINGILTGHSIHYEQGLRRFDRFLDSRDLGHHRLIHRQTTRCIDDNHIVAEFLCLRNSILSFLHRIGFILRRIDLGVNLLSEHTKLLNSGRTIYVARHEHHLLVLLRLEIIGEFGSKRSLTTTLQTRHEDDCRRTLEIDLLRLAAHESRQFVMRDLHHQLPGTNGIDDVLTQCFFLHLIGKLLGSLIVHIRL